MGITIPRQKGRFWRANIHSQASYTIEQEQGMVHRIGLNGFGRIGRLAARELLESSADCELVHINDICAIESAAYLLKYDSVHGTWVGDVEVNGRNIVVNYKGKTTTTSPTRRQLWMPQTTRSRIS